MPIDYSKWDKLELSDDDDIEVHPNIDKASFIRWKQQDIHRKREERKQQIEGLRQELQQNEVLLGRIDDMCQKIESGGVDIFLQTLEQLREANKAHAEFQEKVRKETEDENPPDNFPVHVPTIDEMMAVLFEKIQEEAKNNGKEGDAEYLISKLKEHRQRLFQRSQDAQKELDDLEAEAKKKITMDDLHTGFDKSAVSKVKKQEPPKPKKKSEKKAEQVVEVLNPDAKLKSLEEVNEHEDDDEEMITSDVAKEFAKVKEYERSYQFISRHPEIVNQEVVDQILAEAFQAQLKSKSKYAKRCVHQAWLLQYCQSLGPDGVTLFFRRITSPEAKEQARAIFNNDVEETYNRITERCKVLEEERKGRKQVEQIQIEVTDPNSSLTIRIPEANSTDPTEKANYEKYLGLPEDLRKALESGELTIINKVLGKMSVEEAEKMLAIISETGVLSIEEGIIDTTKGETIPNREAANKAEESQNISTLSDEVQDGQTV